MKRNILVSLAVTGALVMSNPSLAMVRGSGFKWPGGGTVSVIKGKIDRWSAKGVLEAGGFLGLGNTHLKVIPQTVIVDSAGKRLTEKALRPGVQIASIYAVGNTAKTTASATPTTGAGYKVALVIVLDKKQ
ncbi:MAG: hypothetical protein ACYCRH_00710 [Acidiferrobacteraceae bacterium]